MKRYALYPGWTISSSDSQEHYVSYKQLIELYGLNPTECFDATRESETKGLYLGNLEHFYPLASGKYPQFSQQQEDN